MNLKIQFQSKNYVLNDRKGLMLLIRTVITNRMLTTNFNVSTRPQTMSYSQRLSDTLQLQWHGWELKWSLQVCSPVNGRMDCVMSGLYDHSPTEIAISRLRQSDELVSVSVTGECNGK